MTEQIGDEWSRFNKRGNVCAVCHSPVSPPDQSGMHNFVPCQKCGTLLLFDSFGRLNYSAPKSLDSYLTANRIFSTLLNDVLDELPESVARENFAVPLTMHDAFLIVGMVHPILDIVDKLRFVLNRDVLAVKIDQDVYDRLIRSYNSPGG